MRKFVVLLLLPMIMIASTSRWELTYYNTSTPDSTPVSKKIHNFAQVCDSTLWVASANDSMIGDSFYIFPYDPYSYTALQGHDSTSVYFRQADKPSDFSKLNKWTLLKTIGSVTNVPEYEEATGDVFYAKPWLQFMWVTSGVKDSVAIEFCLGMIAVASPGERR